MSYRPALADGRRACDVFPLVEYQSWLARNYSPSTAHLNLVYVRKILVLLCNETGSLDIDNRMPVVRAQYAAWDVGIRSSTNCAWRTYQRFCEETGAGSLPGLAERAQVARGGLPADVAESLWFILRTSNSRGRAAFSVGLIPLVTWAQVVVYKTPEPGFTIARFDSRGAVWAWSGQDFVECLRTLITYAQGADSTLTDETFAERPFVPIARGESEPATAQRLREAIRHVTPACILHEHRRTPDQGPVPHLSDIYRKTGRFPGAAPDKPTP